MHNPYAFGYMTANDLGYLLQCKPELFEIQYCQNKNTNRFLCPESSSVNALIRNKTCLSVDIVEKEL